MSEGEPPAKKSRHEPGAEKRKQKFSPQELSAKFLRILDDVRSWDTIGMFHNPVSEEEVPGYSKIITRPMDLSTLAVRVKNNKYDAAEDFIDDLYLMVSNATSFNERGTVWYNHAKKLSKYLPTVFKKEGIEEAADDAFVPTGTAADVEKTFAKEEKKNTEDYKSTLAGMEEDLEIPIEELMAKYKSADAQKKLAELNAKASLSDNDDDDDDDSSASQSDEGEEEDDDDSSSDEASSDEGSSSDASS